MGTWLTRIDPDPRNRQAREDLRDAVALHHRVMSLVPDDLGPQPRQEAGVLFRLDHTPTGTYLLVQSALPPRLDKLPAGYGTTRTRPLDPLLEALRPGLAITYRITANPTRKLGHHTSAGTPRSVVPLKGADIEEWWQRKAAEAGIRLHTLARADAGSALGTHRGGGHRILHARTRIDGTATITDPTALHTALLAGIGRGKPYGCRLLTIAPLATSH